VKTILVSLIITALAISATPVFARDTIAPGVLGKKFDDLVACVVVDPKDKPKCNQFDYDKDGLVSLFDVFVYIDKFTKMVK